MKITVQIFLIILPALVLAGDSLKDFSAKTEEFQHQVNQQIRGVKTSYSRDTSMELVQMWLSVDETLGDIDNLKMGIGGMIEASEMNCVEKCPTKYDEAIQEADEGYQICLRETHNSAEGLIKDFLDKLHKEWRERNNFQVSKLFELFHGELKGKLDILQSLQADMSAKSLTWDNVAMINLTAGETISRDDLKRKGISSFTCFMIVRNTLFGKIKEIEAFLNDNCLESPQEIYKIYPRADEMH